VPKGSKGSKEAKRRVVARGVVAGKSTRTIAKEAKVSPRHVERLQAEPATKFLIATALAPHHKRITDLAGKAIAAVEGAFKAKTTDTADHMARLRAVGRFGDLARLAQGIETAEVEGANQVTWEQFLVIYGSRKVVEA
jgi:hypothetical protein